MLYIHQSACICHQPTFNEVDLDNVYPSVNNLVHAIEPRYDNVPLGQLRRMGRALRMGVGAGMHLLSKNQVDGILVGTANGGIEDSIMFLNQIMEYEEGRLTPTHFVQSTYNAIAGTMGLITKNKNYNATHVHRGLAFENVLLDAVMLLRENPNNQYLVGGVDEISERNHRLVSLAGWYRKDPVENKNLYTSGLTGTLPGEGAAMFIVNNKPENAQLKLTALKMVNTLHADEIEHQLRLFFEENKIDSTQIDLFLQGENGDSRLVKFYERAERALPRSVAVGRFKHLTGEFQTVTAIATWIAGYFLKTQHIPHHVFKNDAVINKLKKILLYNNYQGAQHSFMILEKV